MAPEPDALTVADQGSQPFLHLVLGLGMVALALLLSRNPEQGASERH